MKSEKTNKFGNSDSTQADTPRSKISRRRLLQTSGIGIASLVGVSTTSAAKNPKNEQSKTGYSDKEIKQFRATVANRYGEEEANVVTKIVKNKLKEAKRMSASKDELYSQITDAIVKNPNTPRGTADIQQVDKEIKNHKRSVVAGNESSRQTSGRSDDVSIAATDISIVGARGRKNSNYNCRVATSSNATTQRIYAVTNASVYGQGYAAGRIYGHFEPPSTRTYEITSRYFRTGFVHDATAKVYFYVRRQGERIYRKTAENIGDGYPEGTTTRSTVHYLLSGKPYTIGVELYTQARAGGRYATIADFYNNPINAERRHLRVRNLRIGRP